MSEYPLLSIIVPVYNTEALLNRCIDSVLNQTYSNWELLIVDDGSTDNSLSICQAYAKQDKRIKVFHQSNQGQSVARNHALKQAKGELITFLDSDDALASSTYEGAIQTLQSNSQCNIAVFPIKWINSQKSVITTYGNSSFIGESSRKKLIDENFQFLVWNKIYRKDLVDGIHFKPGILFEDNLFTFQIAKKVNGICCSDVGYYEYHQEEYHPDKNRWDEKKDNSTISVYLGILPLYQEDNDFDQYVRMKTYLKLTNYLYPRIMKSQVSPKLSDALQCLSKIKLKEVWSPKTELKIQQRIKLTLTQIRATVYTL